MDRRQGSWWSESTCLAMGGNVEMLGHFFIGQGECFFSHVILKISEHEFHDFKMHPPSVVLVWHAHLLVISDIIRP